VDTELFTGGPYSVSRAAYANVLVDYAQAPLHVHEIVNLTGGQAAGLPRCGRGRPPARQIQDDRARGPA
jgi:hypothetical protein